MMVQIASAPAAAPTAASDSVSATMETTIGIGPNPIARNLRERPPTLLDSRNRSDVSLHRSR